MPNNVVLTISDLPRYRGLIEVIRLVRVIVTHAHFEAAFDLAQKRLLEEAQKVGGNVVLGAQFSGAGSHVDHQAGVVIIVSGTAVRLYPPLDEG